jgi:phytanoyl-CoA hydroxylase|eukprot:COSAG06_NODE_11887_length_1451_cov_4.479355_2_plen_168_part_00
MIYLCKTRVHNGCLKVLPKSHRYRTPQHSQTGHSNWQALQQAEDQSELFDNPPNAVDVQADIGDFIVGDARCLHSAHPNQSEERRTCITLWYLNEYHALPHDIQRLYASPWGPGWASGLSADDAALVAPLRPTPPPTPPGDWDGDRSFRGPVLEYLLDPDDAPDAKL